MTTTEPTLAGIPGGASIIDVEEVGDLSPSAETDASPMATPDASQPPAATTAPEAVTSIDHQAALERRSAQTIGTVVDTVDGLTGLALVPHAEEVKTLAALAVTLTAAGNVPRALRDKPNDALLVMLEGRTLGLAPTTALRTLHVIEGSVTVPPKVKLALLHQQGHGRAFPHQAPRQVFADGKLATRLCPCGSDDPANDRTVAVWHAERTDQPGVLNSYTFTWEDGQLAGMIDWACEPQAHSDNCRAQLRKKAHERTGAACKDNWAKYTARMLSWRALGYLLDDTFPEVGTGLYSPDELGAVTDEDGAPIDVTGWESPAGLERTRSARPRPPREPEPMIDEANARELHGRIADMPPPMLDEFSAWWADTGPGGSMEGAPRSVAAVTAKWAKTVAAKVDQLERKAIAEGLTSQEELDMQAEARAQAAPAAPEGPESDPGPDGAADGSEAPGGDPGPAPGPTMRGDGRTTCPGCGDVLGKDRSTGLELPDGTTGSYCPACTPF